MVFAQLVSQCHVVPDQSVQHGAVAVSVGHAKVAKEGLANTCAGATVRVGVDRAVMRRTPVSPWACRPSGLLGLGRQFGLAVDFRMRRLKRPDVLRACRPRKAGLQHRRGDEGRNRLLGGRREGRRYDDEQATRLKPVVPCRGRPFGFGILQRLHRPVRNGVLVHARPVSWPVALALPAAGPRFSPETGLSMAVREPISPHGHTGARRILHALRTALSPGPAGSEPGRSGRPLGKRNAVSLVHPGPTAWSAATPLSSPRQYHEFDPPCELGHETTGISPQSLHRSSNLPYPTKKPKTNRPPTNLPDFGDAIIHLALKIEGHEQIAIRRCPEELEAMAYLRPCGMPVRLRTEPARAL